MTDDSGRIQTRLTPAVTAWLADRSRRMRNQSANIQARVELDLWRVAMAAELRRVPLTLNEACCIADVLNGHLTDATLAAGISLVYAECYDGFRLARQTPLPDESSYGAKWDIDEDRLLAQLRDIGPVADHALQDAIGRWWDQDLTADAAGFGQVGIRIRLDLIGDANSKPSLRGAPEAGR